MAVNSKKIRPIYGELQGYLSQAPEKTETVFYDTALEGQVNEAIEELEKIIGEDFTRFKIQSKGEGDNSYIEVFSYRSKLNGLIMRLYKEYFPEENSPFSGTPSTILQQQQNQVQSQQLLLEFNSQLEEKIKQYKEGTPERTFLEKLKSKLSSVKNYGEMILLAIKIAKEVGLNTDKLNDIFSLNL